MDIFQLVAAFSIGAVATFMFVATGGVGLITTPSLIFLGLSPQTAIATDLFAMLGGRLGGLVGFLKTGQLDMKLAFRLSVIAAFGATIGALLLLAIDEQIMRQVLSLVLLLLLGFLILKPKAGTEDLEPSRVKVIVGHALFFLVGMWGTLIGAGVISLGSAVLLFIFHKRFLETAALLSVIGLAIGLVGMVMFGFNGIIDWSVGIVLLVGKLLGGYFGSLAAVKAGDKWVRYVFIVVVLVSAVALNVTA
jgi:uncharacterized membrane protein YfcA